MDTGKVDGAVALDTWDDVLDCVKTMNDREGALALIYFSSAMATRTEYSKNDPNRAMYLMRDALTYVASQVDGKER